MNIQKSQLQRLQSRISKRRNIVCIVNNNISNLLFLKVIGAFDEEDKDNLRQLRIDAKDMGADQRLDKELFQLLLKHERNKYAQYFRSKYKSIDSEMLYRQCNKNMMAGA